MDFGDKGRYGGLDGIPGQSRVRVQEGGDGLQEVCQSGFNRA